MLGVATTRATCQHLATDAAKKLKDQVAPHRDYPDVFDGNDLLASSAREFSLAGNSLTQELWRPEIGAGDLEDDGGIVGETRPPGSPGIDVVVEARVLQHAHIHDHWLGAVTFEGPML